MHSRRVQRHGPPCGTPAGPSQVELRANARGEDQVVLDPSVAAWAAAGPAFAVRW
jgi:hypothetical protein